MSLKLFGDKYATDYAKKHLDYHLTLTYLNPNLTISFFKSG